MKIRTSDDGFQWSAFIDGQEEDGEYGYGSTAAAAIDDLCEMYDLQKCARCGEVMEADCEPDGCEDMDCPLLGL